MAKIGLRCAVASLITGYSSNLGGEPIYGNGFHVGKLIAAEKGIESNSNPLYGDDAIVENDTSFSGGTIKIGVTDFGMNYTENLQIQSKLLGSKVTALKGGGYSIRRSAADLAPELGFGWFKPKIHNKEQAYEATWLYRVQFQTPSDSTNTKAGSIEWQTPEIEGVIMTVEEFDGGTYEDSAIFTTAAAAKSWLYNKANIEPNADRTEYNTLIQEIMELDPENYTSTSWAELYHTRLSSNATMTKDYTTASEVAGIVRALNNAKSALVVRSA